MKKMNPEVEKLMKQAPEGVNPYYWAIGTLGGKSTREKYSK